MNHQGCAHTVISEKPPSSVAATIRNHRRRVKTPRNMNSSISGAKITALPTRTRKLGTGIYERLVSSNPKPTIEPSKPYSPKQTNAAVIAHPACSRYPRGCGAIAVSMNESLRVVVSSEWTSSCITDKTVSGGLCYAFQGVTPQPHPLAAVLGNW